MVAKTITIDLEAYERLAAEKERHESFSRPIKRRYRRATTAANLLAHLDEICLSSVTLRRIEAVVRSRDASPADSPIV
jgi:predicted CopG family antitoxin